MGTTKTSGWALFWFLTGFMIIWTPAVGAGALGFLAGAAMIAYASYLFISARAKEEI